MNQLVKANKMKETNIDIMFKRSVPNHIDCSLIVVIRVIDRVLRIRISVRTIFGQDLLF